MNHQLQNLEKKRERLIAEAASQRGLVGHFANSLHKPLAMTDKCLNVLSYIKHHPILLAGSGATLLSIAKPNGIGKWLRRSLLVWQLTKKNHP